jgi:hypothetical protein
VPFANTYGFNQYSEITIWLASAEGEVGIRDLKFSSAMFATTKAVPFVLNAGRPEKITIRFTPTSADQFDGKLDVLGSAGNVLVNIPLHAVADCWSPVMCEPKGPTCRINKNNETWQPMSVPNFFKTVSPALDEQASLNAKLVDYDLPVDFILRMAGLGGADGSIGSVSVHVEIPKNVSGVTMVGGGFSEFIFDQATAPKLRVVSGGVPLFDGSLTCVNATFTTSTVRQLGSGSTLPKLNMEIK